MCRTGRFEGQTSHDARPSVFSEEVDFAHSRACSCSHSSCWPQADAQGCLDEPATAKPAGDLVAGAVVVILDPHAMLLDGQNQSPAGETLLFWIEKVDGDRLRVISLDGKKRGWISGTHVVTFAKALEPLGTMIQANPTNARVRFARGRIYVVREEWDRALADLDEAIRLAPNDAMSYAERAHVWHCKHHFDKAIADWDVVLRLDPGNAQRLFVARYGLAASRRIRQVHRRFH